MFTNKKKLNVRRLVGFCLLVLLFWAGVASAAQPEKADNRQVKPVLPPSSFTFEDVLLANVLQMAAGVIQRCNCQNQVSHFQYEYLTTERHRLTIYLQTITSGGTVTIWEPVPFQGSSLPDVLREAAKYMQHGGCDAAVRDVQYERQVNPSDDRWGAPVHIVYLFLESPSPC